MMRQVLMASAAVFALTACGSDKGGAGKSTAAPTDRKAASVSAPSPLDKSFSLKDAQALDVDALFALMPEDARPSYEGFAFDDKLGATVITNLKFSDDGGDGAVTIDRAELYGVDLEAVSRVNAAEDAGIDAPFETIFEKVRLFGVKPDGEGEDAEVSVGAVEIDRLRLRHGGVDDDKAEDSPAHFFNAFELGGLYFKDMAIDAAEDDAGPQVTATIPDMRVVGVGGGKLGALIINDLSYEVLQSDEAVASLASLIGPQGPLIMDSPLKNFIAPGAQRASMESLAWTGMDLSGLLEYGLKDEKPPLTAKNLIKLGDMEMKDVETYVNGRLAYKSERSTFSAQDSTWVIPSKIRAESFGDFYDFSAYVPDDEAELQKVLKESGLDNVKGSSSFAWDWDASKGGAGVTTNFQSDNLADFSLAFDMSGMQIDKIGAAMESNSENAIASVGEFKGMKITLKDEKLLDAIFAIAGMQMGASGSDLRQSAPAMVRLSGSQIAQINPRFSGYVDAFASFLSEGGAIEIEAAPDAPVPLSAVAAAGEAGPQTLPDLLDLTVTHKN